jgi:hypothetical protein
VKKPSSRERQQRLRQYWKEYEAIKARIREVGFICEGSLVKRYLSCGKPNCRCSTDPNRRHGPYHQLSWKEAGTTVSRRLTPGQAALYEEWIANRHRLHALLHEMRTISRKAGRHLMKEVDQAEGRPPRKSAPSKRSKPRDIVDPRA